MTYWSLEVWALQFEPLLQEQICYLACFLLAQLYFSARFLFTHVLPSPHPRFLPGACWLMSTVHWKNHRNGLIAFWLLAHCRVLAKLPPAFQVWLPLQAKCLVRNHLAEGGRKRDPEWSVGLYNTDFRLKPFMGWISSSHMVAYLTSFFPLTLKKEWEREKEPPWPWEWGDFLKLYRKTYTRSKAEPEKDELLSCHHSSVKCSLATNKRKCWQSYSTPNKEYS